jgi:hypothetical protein
MKSKKRSTRPRRQTEEPVYYALRIESWDWDYSFQIADSKWEPDEVYSDYRHLDVGGSLTHPKELGGHAIKLSFVPSDDLLGKRAHLYKARPDNVDCINRGRQTKVFSGVFSMPVDVLPTIVPMLLGERLRFLVLQGRKLHYGSASMRSYRAGARRYRPNLRKVDLTTWYVRPMVLSLSARYF